MNTVCMKCKEWMDPLEEIYATASCGHLYHKRCLAKSFDRSSKTMTCPCSSNQITSKNVVRLHPTVPKTTEGDEQSSLVHSSLDAAEALVTYQRKLLNYRDEEFKVLNNKLKEQEEQMNQYKNMIIDLQQDIESQNIKIAEDKELHQKEILDLKGEIAAHQGELEEKAVTISVLAKNTREQIQQIKQLSEEKSTLEQNVDSLNAELSATKNELTRICNCLEAYQVDIELLGLGLSNATVTENAESSPEIASKYQPHELLLPLLPLMTTENAADTESTQPEPLEYQNHQPVLPLLPLRFEEAQGNQIGNFAAMG